MVPVHFSYTQSVTSKNEPNELPKNDHCLSNRSRLDETFLYMWHCVLVVRFLKVVHRETT